MAGNTHPATAAEISATLAEATESELEALLERYADDPRAQVRRACGVVDLAPAQTGRRGRPAKHGKHLSVETDFTFSNEKIGHRITILYRCKRADFVRSSNDFLCSF